MTLGTQNIGTWAPWDFKRMELWDLGTFEQWNFGIMRLWDIGTLGSMGFKAREIWDHDYLRLLDNMTLDPGEVGTMQISELDYGLGTMGLCNCVILWLWNHGTFGPGKFGTNDFWTKGLLDPYTLGPNEFGTMGLWDHSNMETWRKFPLAPMGVLAPRSAHAQPPIHTSENFPPHMSAESFF